MANDTPDVAQGLNPIYFYIGLGALAVAGAGYWFFTQKPSSKSEADVNAQQKKNEEQNKSDNSTPAASDYSMANSAKTIYPNSPQSSGSLSIGDAALIRAGVKPRRLNEKLEYVSEGEAKHVTVKLGTIWGWTDSGHGWVTNTGKTIDGVIIKSDDKKVAPFYEVKLKDIDKGNTATKIADKIGSFFDDGEGMKYIGADGFGTLPAKVTQANVMFEDNPMCRAWDGSTASITELSSSMEKMQRDDDNDFDQDGFASSKYYNNIGMDSMSIIESKEKRKGNPAKKVDVVSHNNNIGFDDVSILELKGKDKKKPIVYKNLVHHNSWQA